MTLRTNGNLTKLYHRKQYIGYLVRRRDGKGNRRYYSIYNLKGWPMGMYLKKEDAIKAAVRILILKETFPVKP